MRVVNAKQASEENTQDKNSIKSQHQWRKVTTKPEEGKAVKTIPMSGNLLFENGDSLNICKLFCTVSLQNGFLLLACLDLSTERWQTLKARVLFLL